MIQSIHLLLHISIIHDESEKSYGFYDDEKRIAFLEIGYKTILQ
jgi:hypothetical protein